MRPATLARCVVFAVVLGLAAASSRIQELNDIGSSIVADQTVRRKIAVNLARQ